MQSLQPLGEIFLSQMAQRRTSWTCCRCGITEVSCWRRWWTIISCVASPRQSWFWVPMPSTTSSFTSYYVWPCNIHVTVTPRRSQKLYPLLCSKAQTNPQRSSLWHLWAFDEIKARSKVVTEMLPALSCYIPDICVCHDKHTAQSTSGVTPNRDHQTWEKTCSSRECGKMMFSTAQVKINHLRTNPWD